jgi:hypothetical protein
MVNSRFIFSDNRAHFHLSYVAKKQDREAELYGIYE